MYINNYWQLFITEIGCLVLDPVGTILVYQSSSILFCQQPNSLAKIQVSSVDCMSQHLAPPLIPLITTIHTHTLIPLSPPCLLFQEKYVSVTYLAPLTRIKTLLAREAPDWLLVLSFAVHQCHFPPLSTELHLFVSLCPTNISLNH